MMERIIKEEHRSLENVWKMIEKERTPTRQQMRIDSDSLREITLQMQPKTPMVQFMVQFGAAHGAV